ncbi:hypothetical protein Tco_0425081 [Tanacetum coccineum]
MDAAAMKHMASNFAKLNKFEGIDFRRWQKKMHFLLSSMSVVYVLTTPIPVVGGDDATVEQIRKRAKWDNNDYVCRGLICNASNFSKLDKFKGMDFRRWQKKMHFLLSSMSVVYVLITPIPEDGGDDATVEQIRKRVKWDNDDYVCRGLILNGMSDSLFDIYKNVESFKELWNSLEAKYMADDASSK